MKISDTDFDFTTPRPWFASLLKGWAGLAEGMAGIFDTLGSIREAHYATYEINGKQVTPEEWDAARIKSDWDVTFRNLDKAFTKYPRPPKH